MVNIPETSPDMACRFWLHDIARNGKMEDVKEFIVDKKISNLKNTIQWKIS